MVLDGYKASKFHLGIILPLFLAMSFPLVPPGFCSGKAKHPPAILSPSHPKDSRGEMVYESQGKKQLSEPVVPGTLLLPTLVKLSEAKYPESQIRSHFSGGVTVEGVVAENGDFIDRSIVSVLNNPDSDFLKSAMDATAQYHFRPAKLDDKPVAVLIRVEVNFLVQ